MFDFGIFCLGDISDGSPSEYVKSFVFSFLSFSFLFLSFFSFSILHFLIFLSLSLTLGPLDIVHPCHSVATPLITTQFCIVLYYE